MSSLMILLLSACSIAGSWVYERLDSYLADYFKGFADFSKEQNQEIELISEEFLNWFSENELLKIKLKNSIKDFTENIMITDLVRNDLSVNAKRGSVKVEDLCQVYTFDKIHQMITTISSCIEDETHFCDVLKATFPMGSMTGAPKINSMKLIDFFEEFRRGVFSGSIGYITPETDFDFNVVIRTILYDEQNKYLSIGVGGAITTNSIPIEEYKECIIKVKPIFDLLNFKLDD